MSENDEKTMKELKDEKKKSIKYIFTSYLIIDTVKIKQNYNLKILDS